LAINIVLNSALLIAKFVLIMSAQPYLVEKGDSAFLELWVSGTIKRQKGHFVRVESTTNCIERDSHKHMFMRLPPNLGHQTCPSSLEFGGPYRQKILSL
jgi:hypothetical protein